MICVGGVIWLGKRDTSTYIRARTFQACEYAVQGTYARSCSSKGRLELLGFSIYHVAMYSSSDTHIRVRTVQAGDYAVHRAHVRQLVWCVRFIPARGYSGGYRYHTVRYLLLRFKRYLTDSSFQLIDFIVYFNFKCCILFWFVFPCYQTTIPGLSVEQWALHP
jgi:hypothetical protein